MNTFICADLHLSHRGITKFLRADGITKERPFDTVEEMDEALIQNWNSVVAPKDTVVVLGDVVINRSALPLLARLNGSKELVKGNHDVFRDEEYLHYFTKIHAMRILDNFICTHIPIHPASIERWVGNIHGHLHSNRVKGGNGEIDPRYLCVSMEQIDFTPVSFEDAKKRWMFQQG
jgi:calcineurin-like phosphoesterase family protein